jgi:ligand-binding sensor domain-containing protein
VFSGSNGLPTESAVTSLAVASDGTVYVGTSNNGLFIFDGQTWRGVGGPRYITAMAFNRDGSVWVASYSDGIGHYDGTAWRERFLPGTGFPSSWLQAILALPDGTLWVGGDGGAVRIMRAATGSQ